MPIWISPVATSTVKTAAWISIATWVSSSRRCLGQRSVKTPPTSVSSVIGKNWKAVTRPRSNGEWVSWITSQSCAVRCIQVPVSETICPIQYRR